MSCSSGRCTRPPAGAGAGATTTAADRNTTPSSWTPRPRGGSRFLNVNAEVADVARVGPIRTQADSITRMLRSHTTAVHVVSLLEEMPVQETVDALEELRKASLPLGAIVINQVNDPLLGSDGLAAVGARADGLSASVTADLKSASVRTSAAMVAGLLAEAEEHVDRVALQQEQGVLLEQGRQVYRLPLLPEGTEAGGSASRRRPHGAGDDLMPASATEPTLDIDGLLGDQRTRIIVCCGPAEWARPPSPHRSVCGPPRPAGAWWC